METATPIKMEVGFEMEEADIGATLSDMICVAPRLRFTADLYVGGSVVTVEAAGISGQRSIRPADHLDELLAADMREVWQRDYQRRQEHAAETGREA